MRDQDVIDILERCKSDEKLCRSFDSDRSWALVSKACGFEEEAEKTSYGARDYIEYYVWQFTHAALKPMAASLAVFVFLVTGWFSAVNASNHALPGEKLYRVKLSMENVRLAVALTPEQKTQLQIEFANRRLEEMVNLSASSRDDRAEAVLLAVERFKENVVSIKEELDAENAELAKVASRKADVYKTAVESSAELNEEEVAEVQEIIDETKEQAVEVIITTHEASQDEETAKELEAEFEKRFAALEEVGDEKKLELARALQEEGLYRRAFQVLKEIELTIAE